MVDIIAYGKNLSSGQYKKLDASDSLTDTAGTVLSGASATNLIKGYSLCFAGDLTAASRYLIANGITTNVGVASSTDGQTIATAPVAGEITAFSLNAETATPTADIEIRVNTTTEFSAQISNTKNAWSGLSIAVSAGDEIEIFSNGLNNECNAVVVISDTGSTGLGYVQFVGADLTTTGNFAAAHGSGLSTQATSQTRTRVSVPVDGTLNAVSWNQATASSATMKFHLNGVEDDTFTASGNSGVDTSVSITVSAGDYIELEYDAGTAPGDSSWWYHITPSDTSVDGTGLVLSTGGNAGTTVFHRTNAVGDDATGLDAPSGIFVFPTNGTVHAISIERATAADVQTEIHINNVIIGIIQAGASSNTVSASGLNIPIQFGDSIGTRVDASGQGNSQVEVYIK